jgi:hypothetical protein
VLASVTRRSGDHPHTQRCGFGGAGAEIRHGCRAERNTHCILPLRPRTLRRRRYLLVTCRKHQAGCRSVAQAQHALAKIASIGDKPLYNNYSECCVARQSEYPPSGRFELNRHRHA